MVEGTLQQRVGANIRRIRAASGLSQESYAERLGFNRTYIGSLERGQRNLSLRALERLANLIDVDPLSLLADDSAKPDRRRKQL